MQEDIVFKRRNRLRTHFVNTSNVLLYMYKSLSADAKITYQVIDSFDWEDKETGECKGYVFPATKTLAEIRGVSIRTIQRHIKELEKVGLLTRQRRSHKASFLIIEDPSEKESQKYLEIYVTKVKPVDPLQKSNDKIVVSPKGSQTTKMTVDNINIKKDEKKENEINVNGNFKAAGKGLTSINQILKRFDFNKRTSAKRNSVTRKNRGKPEDLSVIFPIT